MHMKSSSGSSPQIVLGVVFALGCHLCQAAGPQGVRVDGTLGKPATTLPGKTYKITEDVGKLSGSNLFHSFNYFNIGTGEKALFSTTSPGINNIIARVTGNYASEIGGTISVQAAHGAPNLYLMNPAGVTFTAGAVIDVPAAFHVTTADYLKFPDGAFYADATKQSSFSSANPSAFGFLGDKRASIELQKARLHAGAGGDAEFDMVAGDISISADPSVEAGIVNSTGAIRLASVGGQTAEIPMSGAATSADGKIELQPGAVVETQGTSGMKAGAIDLNARTISVDGTDADVLTGVVSFAGKPGADPISLNAGKAIVFLNGAGVFSETFTTGVGGDIVIKTPALGILGVGVFATGLFAETSDTKAGGSINVDVGDLTIVGGNQPVSDATTGIGTYSHYTGAPGSIEVSARGALSIERGGFIKSTAYGAKLSSSAASSSGDVTVIAGSIALSGATGSAESNIDSQLGMGAIGKAGSVTVISKGDLRLTDNSNIFSQSDDLADSGPVTVTAASLYLDGGLEGGPNGTGASITSDAGDIDNFQTGLSTPAGNAGELKIMVGGPIALIGRSHLSADSIGSGNAGNLIISGNSLTMTGIGHGYITGISASSLGDGRGSDVNIDIAGPISVSNSGPPDSAGFTGEVFIGATTYGSGAQSALSIKAQSLDIGGNAVISTANFGKAPGAAMNIEVSGGLTVKNGADVGSGTAGEGAAGNVTIKADTVTLDGGALGADTGILSRSVVTSPGGAAGAVSVVASGAVLLENGGRIDSNTDSAGNAGNVTITAASLAINGGVEVYPNLASGIPEVTGISSRATLTSKGSAGSISINVGGNISLTDGGRIDSSTDAMGNAGDVDILAAGTLSIGGGRKRTTISSQASGRAHGAPGSVSITASTFAMSDLGLVTIQDDRSFQDVSPIPHHLSVQTNDLTMNGGAITAASSGLNDASSIEIEYRGSARVKDALVTTSATSGNGGPISVIGDGVLWLERSQVTTSVRGPETTPFGHKNGGNINITAPFIVLDSAAIQANTEIPVSSGGTITVNVNALLPSYGSFMPGGSLQLFDASLAGFNLVQAVAPDGVDGALNLTKPTLDLGTSLLGLTGRLAAAPALARRACGYTSGSTLAPSGRGGLPPASADLLNMGGDESGYAAGLLSSGYWGPRLTALEIGCM